MPRRLILIRHSLSEMEREVPVANWRLSAEGVQRARRFAARIEPGTADRVFTSPEPKAAQTAALLGDAWNLPVVEVPGLHEHERPEPRILPRDRFEALVREVFARPSDIVFGAESADRAAERFDAALMGLVDADTRDVVAVSHGTVIALFVARHTGADPFELWKRQEMPFAVTLALPELTLEKVTFLIG